MDNEQWAAGYQAYLLRLWKGGEGWRVSLDDPRTGTQRAFPDLEALFAFLSAATTGQSAGRARAPNSQERIAPAPDCQPAAPATENGHENKAT